MPVHSGRVLGDEVFDQQRNIRASPGGEEFRPEILSASRKSRLWENASKGGESSEKEEPKAFRAVKDGGR